MDKFEEETSGKITEAITNFGLSMGDVIEAIFENGNIDHKKALRKIFLDALNEAERRLRLEFQYFDR